MLCALPDDRRGHAAEPAGAQVGREEMMHHYFPEVASCELTVLKVVCNCDPRAFTTAMIATEMPAAISPYSMAVAHD
jgi:hypothetical protein